MLVEYAGGTVAFHLPKGWDVAEIPVGREVRLFAGPLPLTIRNRSLQRGLWMSHHRNPTGLTTQSELSADLLTERLLMAAGRDAQPGATEWIELGEQRMLRQGFSVSAQSPTPPISGNSTRQPRAGFHLLGRTDWGWFELHVVAAAGEEAMLFADVEWLLASLQLAAPRTPEPMLEPQGPAQPMPVGTWKAYRSRLRIRPDGHVTLIFDRRGHFSLTADGRLRFDRRLVRLAGQYVLEDDLLQVTWSDGSRQNFRWKFSDDGDLLLTDHLGRIAQLKWLFE